MTPRPLRLPGGRYAVPGNRWDLVADRVRPGGPASVSVIVPYYRERARLELVLEGLRRQDYPTGRFEVVVADDGSPDPYRPAGSDGSDGGPAIRVVRQDDRGFRAAAARNLGARAAEGELLCFVDQDTVPEPGYLRHLTRLPALVPDAVTVGRRRHADLDGWTPGRLRDWLTGGGPAPRELPAPAWLDDAYRGSRDLLVTDDSSYRFVISAVMCCPADLFAEIGGFDESFTSYGGEDWELAYRAYNAGAVLAHVPAAVAWHDGPDWAGRGDADSRRRVKAGEADNLARLIPRPDRDDAAPVPRPADMVVSWTGADRADEPSLHSALRDLLASPINCVVHLDPFPPGIPPSPRIRPGPPPADVLARARHLVEVDGALAPTGQMLDTVRKHLGDEAAGRVVLGPPGAPLLTAVSTRAARRAARWQAAAPGSDLVDELFGTVVER